MNTDSYFSIGCTHIICEDYAYSNNRDKDGIKGNPFIVVCDGCSSAQHVDFGARLLARSATPFLVSKGHVDPIELLHGTIHASAAIGRSLNLSPESLTSTLLAAKIVEEKYVQVFHFGDGVIAFKYKDCPLLIIQTEFVSEDNRTNAPYYPRYELDGEIKKIYSEQCKNIRQHDITDSGRSTRTFPFSPEISRQYPTENLEFIALMSDGVNSFSVSETTTTGRVNQPIDILEILKELLAFKNFKGRFVQRRCNKAFQTFAKNGWKNADDVSLAVIAFD